jgi:hypothetical protein
VSPKHARLEPARHETARHEPARRAEPSPISQTSPTRAATTTTQHARRPNPSDQHQHQHHRDASHQRNASSLSMLVTTAMRESTKTQREESPRLHMRAKQHQDATGGATKMPQRPPSHKDATGVATKTPQRPPAHGCSITITGLRKQQLLSQDVVSVQASQWSSDASMPRATGQSKSHPGRGRSPVHAATIRRRLRLLCLPSLFAVTSRCCNPEGALPVDVSSRASAQRSASMPLSRSSKGFAPAAVENNKQCISLLQARSMKQE